MNTNINIIANMISITMYKYVQNFAFYITYILEAGGISSASYKLVITKALRNNNVIKLYGHMELIDKLNPGDNKIVDYLYTFVIDDDMYTFRNGEKE